MLLEFACQTSMKYFYRGTEGGTEGDLPLLKYIGRPVSATTAGGSFRLHGNEQRDLIERALTVWAWHTCTTVCTRTSDLEKKKFFQDGGRHLERMRHLPTQFVKWLGKQCPRSKTRLLLGCCFGFAWENFFADVNNAVVEFNPSAARNHCLNICLGGHQNCQECQDVTTAVSTQHPNTDKPTEVPPPSLPCPAQHWPSDAKSRSPTFKVTNATTAKSFYHQTIKSTILYLLHYMDTVVLKTSKHCVKSATL